MMADTRDSTGKVINCWVAIFADGRSYTFHIENNIHEVAGKAGMRHQVDTGRGSGTMIVAFRNISLSNAHRRRFRSTI